MKSPQDYFDFLWSGGAGHFWLSSDTIPMVQRPGVMQITPQLSVTIRRSAEAMFDAARRNLRPSTARQRRRPDQLDAAGIDGQSVKKFRENKISCEPSARKTYRRLSAVPEQSLDRANRNGRGATKRSPKILN